MDHRLSLRLVVAVIGSLSRCRVPIVAIAIVRTPMRRRRNPPNHLRSTPARASRPSPAAGDSTRSPRPLAWDPCRTAIVVCDMWNEHWCKGATRRVAEMAPRMNDVLVAARKRGVLIIHCPSDTMKFYEGTAAARTGSRAAPHVATKVPLKRAATSMASAKAICRSTTPTAAAIAIRPASRGARGRARSRP